eukprot:GHVU01025267.1.p1 GENE.GHVU01025267.1~~GHVU01025267.1.p1  ORF type:complete len:112 (-),score=5.99 GHVU01025267.1:134-469(-)
MHLDTCSDTGALSSQTLGPLGYPKYAHTHTHTHKRAYGCKQEGAPRTHGLASSDASDPHSRLSMFTRLPSQIGTRAHHHHPQANMLKHIHTLIESTAASKDQYNNIYDINI